MSLIKRPYFQSTIMIAFLFFINPSFSFGQECDCEAYIEVGETTGGSGCCTRPMFSEGCVEPITFEMKFEDLELDEQDSYCWSESVGNSGVGLWTLTATDANGCTAIASAIPTEDCTDACNCQVTFDVWGCCMYSNTEGCNGAIDIQWTLDGEPFITPYGNDHGCEDGLPPGLYTVTVTDEDGCTDTDEIVLPENWCDCFGNTCEPLITKSGDCSILVCAFGECELPGEFIVTAPNNVPIDLPSNFAGCAGLDISGFGSGEYCVTYTSDENGCVSEQSCITIDDCDDCACGITTLTESDCKIRACISDFMTDCQGPLTFQWETPSGLNPSGTVTNPTGFVTCNGIDAVEAGTYCVTLTDAEGCISSACIDVEGCSCDDFPACDPLITQSGDCSILVCAFDECELPGEFLVTVPNNTSPITLASNFAGCAGLDISSFGSGEYCVEYVSQYGCVSEQSCTTIEDCNDCACSITTLTESDCRIRACISDFMTECEGPLTFKWETPSGLNPTGTISNPTGFVTCSGINAAEEGLYCVTLTDANGCVSSACIEVENCSCDDLPSLDVEIVGFNCVAGKEYLVASNPNGGLWDYCSTDYSVEWSDGAIGCGNGCICGEVRTVIVTDLQTGCTGTDSYQPVECKGDDSDIKLREINNMDDLELALKASIKVSPNPTQGIINVDVTSPSGQPGEINIINSNGQLLETINIERLNTQNTTRIKVDLSEYQGNLFFVNYNDGIKPVIMKVSKF